MITPPILIDQMREMAIDDLPQRWQMMANTICKREGTKTETNTESPGLNLQQWLHEIYFHKPGRPDLDKADIERLGHIIARFLCFGPSVRVSAREVTW
jgi:hypothetical protein